MAGANIPSFEYPRNVRFECRRCAICCSDTKERIRSILLLKIEAERISKKTLKNVNEFAEKIEGFEPYIYRMKKTSDEGKCIFLQDRACTIYQIRPIICMFYPFELKTSEGNRYMFAYTDECLGIGEGLRLRKNYFEKLFKKSLKTVKENEEHE